MTVLRNRNLNRHAWKNNFDTTTLTLSMLYTSWQDFVDMSGIDGDNVEYEKVFNIIYIRFGDLYTIENTSNYVTAELRYHIEDEYVKYEKAKELYDEEIDRLKGLYQESKIYNVGDIQEEGIEDYDNFLAMRSTNTQSFDILGQIERIQNNNTPFTSMIKNICDKMFKAWNEMDYLIEVV